MKIIPNHWWNNRFFPDHTPLDTVKRKLREWLWGVRIDLCWDESDGFDVGCFYACNKASLGPFMLHRQSECKDRSHHEDCCLRPECYGPWRLMIAMTPKAFDGFDEAAIK